MKEFAKRHFQNVKPAHKFPEYNIKAFQETLEMPEITLTLLIAAILPTCGKMEFCV